MSTNSAPTARSPDAPGKARQRRRPLWQVPAFVAGVLALLGASLGRPLFHESPGSHLLRDLGTARQFLDSPNGPLDRAEALTQGVPAQPDGPDAQAAQAHFLLGSVYLRQASQPPGGAEDLWQKARVHLEQAEQLGVPESDRPHLDYRLGKVYFHAKEDPKKVVEYLAR